VKTLSFRTKYLLVSSLYFLLATYSWAYKYFSDRYRNYRIFERVFWHERTQTNLYLVYPQEYHAIDSNHFGPLFGILIAPFALLPAAIGMLFFNLINAFPFVWVVYLLPLDAKRKLLITLCCIIEFANSVHSIQVNPIIAVLIILSFLMVEKGKDQWATLFIVMGTLIKLYPISGLAFFMFSKNKVKFVVSGIFWLVLLFCLPMLISTPHFILQSYVDWYHALAEKNLSNVSLVSSQDLCIMGVFRRITANPALPNTPFLVCGAVVFLFGLFRFNQYNSLKFRLYVLASALLMVVLFSTGSEPPTYIIAVAGVMIWLFLQEKPFSTGNIILLVSLLLITGLGTTDAIPKSIRKSVIEPYELKVWPCAYVWLRMSYEMIFNKFKDPGFLLASGTHLYLKNEKNVGTARTYSISDQ
jgi:hypothetical protein